MRKIHIIFPVFIVLFFGPPEVSSQDTGEVRIGGQWESRRGQLTPAQNYAGEILSYLLQVVLGKAGNPKHRKDWAIRGIEEPLDLKYISEIMTDSEKSEQAVMVLDPNILGLSKILYYYDERLSLYKGKFEFASIYPAPEFLAIRLLLLQKIHRGEKINLKALLDRKRMIFDGNYRITKDDLKAVNLNKDEVQLIRHVIHKEPHLFGYLQSPFLIKAFYAVDVVRRDEFVEKRIQEADDRLCECRLSKKTDEGLKVKIAILPSMTKEFYYGDAYHDLSVYGFRPTESLEEVIENVKTQIINRTEHLMMERFKETFSMRGTGDGFWKKIVEEKIEFHLGAQKPFVIYPDNAGEVIDKVCPGADLSIILLGKNVYLALRMENEKDVYPHVPWIYLDIMDVKYGQVQEEIDQISRFIAKKFGDEMERLLKKIGS